MQTLDVLTVNERDEAVTTNYSTFPFPEKRNVEILLDQDPRLVDIVMQLASSGIWGKLNSLNGVKENAKFIFTGQQPTIDYGIYRRVAKRAGVHNDVETIHMHADHDKAKKSGFGNLKMPYVSENGQLEYRKYVLFDNFEEDDVMSDVPVPCIESAKEFFARVITDSEISIDRVSQIFGSSTPYLSTDILRSCEHFILENFHLLRSAAELNAAIQTFVIRCIEPRIKTIDFMLSDFLKSDLVRESLAKQLLNMPEWIKAYNVAAEHINKTEYKDRIWLPKPLKSYETDEGTFYELPLWILDNSEQRYDVRERVRACMIVKSDEFIIGKCIDGNFEPLVTINKDTSIEYIKNSEGFKLLSPAAITLVDILRYHIHFPIVHGLTGHYYESVNELTRAMMNGLDNIESGKVVNPNTLGEISPVTNASYETRKRGVEASLLNKAKKEQMDKLSSLESKFKDTTAEKVEHIRTLNTISNELSLSQFLKDTDLEKEIQSMMQLEGTDNAENEIILEFKVGKKSSKITKRDIAEILYQFYSKSQFEDLIQYFERNGYTNLVEFCKYIEPWINTKNSVNYYDGILRELKVRIEEVKNELQEIVKFEDNDTPLLAGAVWRPKTVNAIFRHRKSIINSLEC